MLRTPISGSTQVVSRSTDPAASQVDHSAAGNHRVAAELRVDLEVEDGDTRAKNEVKPLQPCIPVAGSDESMSGNCEPNSIQPISTALSAL